MERAGPSGACARNGLYVIPERIHERAPNTDKSKGPGDFLDRRPAATSSPGLRVSVLHCSIYLKSFARLIPSMW